LGDKERGLSLVGGLRYVFEGYEVLCSDSLTSGMSKVESDVPREFSVASGPGPLPCSAAPTSSSASFGRKCHACGVTSNGDIPSEANVEAATSDFASYTCLCFFKLFLPRFRCAGTMMATMRHTSRRPPTTAPAIIPASLGPDNESADVVEDGWDGFDVDSDGVGEAIM
jgi:hypothetical protein